MNIKLFKQMRHEWRSNVWLIVELIIISVVMWFCISSLMSDYLVLAEPRGHDISHVYRVYIGNTQDNDGRNPSELMAELIDRIRRRPEVEYAAYSRNSIPYTGSSMSAQLQHEDTINPKNPNYGALHRWVQPDFFNVFRIRGVRGETPEQLAKILQPGTNVFAVTQNTLMDTTYTIVNSADLIGEKFNLGGYPDHTLAAVTERMKRFDDESLSNLWGATGVFDMMVDPALVWANELSVRVRANMDDGSFIDNLMNDSQSSLKVGCYYIMNVESFADIRANAQREMNVNLRNYAVGIGFLLLNVFLGLLGSFWFRTQQRVSEIAVHKVHGSSSGMVFCRLISEGFVLLMIATLFAWLVDWLLIHYDMVIPARPEPYSVWMALLTLLLMALMIVGGIYFPARKAMSIAPALALHDE